MRYVLLTVFTLTGLFSGSLFAQSGEIIIENDLQQEILRETGGAQEYVELPAQQAQPQARRVLILNRTAQTTAQVQQQPVTNVEATPLTASRAEQLRKARQDAEVSTEQKIVEKLEQSRLEDEKRRANQLFGDKLNNNAQEQQVQAEIAPAPAQVQVVPVVQEQEQEPSMDEVKDDILSSVRAELDAQKEEASTSDDRLFISGNIGVTGYQDAINVESNEAMGFSVGSRVDEKYIVEGSFLYSNHYVDDASRGFSRTFVYDELDQYNFMVGAKYAPKFGKFSPQVGGLVSYTHRKYAEVNNYNSYSSQTNYTSNEAETDSFDLGLTMGLDIHIGDSFVIGAEYRYITNLTSKSQSRYLNDYYSYYDVDTPLEEFDYYTFAIVGKILF